MTVKSPDDVERLDFLCEAFADAFVEATADEIDEAICATGSDPAALEAEVASTIELALSKSLKKKLVEAGLAARREMTARPDLSNLSREQLVEKLRLVTANEDNAGEMLTMAARAGRGSMPIEELRSLLEDLYSVSNPNTDND